MEDKLDERYGLTIRTCEKHNYDYYLIDGCDICWREDGNAD